MASHDDLVGLGIVTELEEPEESKESEETKGAEETREAGTSE